MNDTVGSRELAREVALRRGETAEDFGRYMPTVQHWIRSGLFHAASAGAAEQNPRRGRARRFPSSALKWARFFDALSSRGASTVDLHKITAILAAKHPKAIQDALAGHRSAVWVVYGDFVHVQRGGVQLPSPGHVEWSNVAICANLTGIFNR